MISKGLDMARWDKPGRNDRVSLQAIVTVVVERALVRL